MANNRGPEALLIMWVMTSLTWAFVGLRFLTRIFVVRIVGADDYVYVLSAVRRFLCCFALSLVFTPSQNPQRERGTTGC